MHILVAPTLLRVIRQAYKLAFRFALPLLAAAAGAIGGPLAFVAGEAAGAVSFSEPTTTLVAIGFGWMILLPALVRLATRFDGHDRVYAAVRA